MFPLMVRLLPANFFVLANKCCFLLLQAIAYMGDDFMFQLFGKYRDMALAVKNPCHLNMAACLIKLKRYDDGIAHCSIVCICFLKIVVTLFFALFFCLI